MGSRSKGDARGRPQDICRPRQWPSSPIAIAGPALSIEPRADESSSQSNGRLRSALSWQPTNVEDGDLTGLHSNAVGNQSTSDLVQQTSGNPVNANETPPAPLSTCPPPPPPPPSSPSTCSPKADL